MGKVSRKSKASESVHEKKSVESVVVGAKVFAQGKGHLPWPAMILQQLGGEPKKYLVQFYGTYDSERVDGDKIYPYSKENLKQFGHADPFRAPQLFDLALSEIKVGECPGPKSRHDRHTKVKRLRRSTVEWKESEEKVEKKKVTAPPAKKSKVKTPSQNLKKNTKVGSSKMGTGQRRGQGKRIISKV